MPGLRRQSKSHLLTARPIVQTFEKVAMTTAEQQPRPNRAQVLDFRGVYSTVFSNRVLS